jgi:hypothetical protein
MTASSSTTLGAASSSDFGVTSTAYSAQAACASVSGVNSPYSMAPM